MKNIPFIIFMFYFSFSFCNAQTQKKDVISSNLEYFKTYPDSINFRRFVKMSYLVEELLHGKPDDVGRAWKSPGGFSICFYAFFTSSSTNFSRRDDDGDYKKAKYGEVRCGYLVNYEHDFESKDIKCMLTIAMKSDSSPFLSKLHHEEAIIKFITDKKFILTGNPLLNGTYKRIR